MSDQAGPSRPRPKPSGKPANASAGVSTVGNQDDARTNIASTVTGANPSTAQDEEGDEDEERMDFKLIQSFADKIQHLPTTDDLNGATARVNIIIPKRGEKDFEPLQETVNLQDMMLQKSREALFSALLGVRGGHSKSISHAILTPSRPFPRVLIVHGHHFDSMGMTVRYPPPPGSKGKGKTGIELLPEEALYLLERGSLQIWLGREPETEAEEEDGVGEWCEEEYGVRGAVEMSAMEGFGAFIGREGLSWERYQFIPEYFLAPTTMPTEDLTINGWYRYTSKWLSEFFRGVWTNISGTLSKIGSVGLNLRLQKKKGSLLDGWRGATYPGHDQALPSRLLPPTTKSIYDPLVVNPYLPFFHIWKPATPWSKRVWDKGDGESLQKQRPDYFAAIVEARSTPIPTIDQLTQVFDMLPDEPKGPIKRVGPQYERQAKARPPRVQNKPPQEKVSRIRSWLSSFGLIATATPTVAPNFNIGAVRNGDRAFIVAVNDSGNAGWVRFGRTGFAEAAVI
ncbi:hypothetical protein CI109_106986 [Kwoniella shandongensis]|uniref:tRNA-splicing endonuclease subunit Sen54 N-terminal domain-containing protein n=1 Tax=Kwoniella shandongensis TaxID=1734106 RepID=A0AAJ8N0G3_9TREE